MEFRSIWISTPARLSVRRGQLVIRREEEITIPMEDLTSVMLESQAAAITAAALGQLAGQGVTVYVCDGRHLPAALLLPMNRHSRQLKMLRGQIAMTRPLQKRLWQGVVAAKIGSQARCLELLERPGAGELRELARAVRSGDPDNREAAAAALYFPALFGSGFTRGEECLTNAALNYGYAIVRGAMARCLAVHGLEPCLGICHHSELNQFNLADDLMEPYRPLVDLYVAARVPREGELTPEIKQQLFTLTNYLVELGGRRQRMITALGRTAESFARAVTGTEREGLALPGLLALEPCRYE